MTATMTGSPLKVGLISLGCAKNRVDSEIMLGLLTEAGYRITARSGEADVIIINTCGFIAPAKEEAIATILETARLKEDGRLKALLVAGCLAQRYPQQLLSEIPEIDGIFGTGDIGRVNHFIEKALAGDRPGVINRPEFDYGCVLPRVLTTPAYSVYVKIADGCSNRCTFCAIPGIRGGYRSRPLEVLEKEVAGLVSGGAREIILVAQDTTAYGTDLYGRPMLAELLRRLSCKGAPWIRLMYCYPTGFNAELIKVIQEEKSICRYIDLPLQHINDDILKRMNRRGTAGEIKELIDNLRSSIAGLTLRTTFMVGFPGENESQFQELYRFIEEARFERLGVFKYSPEEGTAASSFADNVPDEVKELRYNMLMTLQKDISYKLNQAKVGSIARVLVEGKKSGRASLYFGRTEGDAPEIDGQVLFSGGSKVVESGDFVRVRITKAFNYGLRGVLVR